MDGFQIIVAILFLFAAGILMIGKPEVFWKIEHFLTVREGKPSALYLAIVRISGVACIFFGLFFTVRLFIS